MRRQEICKLDLAIERIDIITILVQRVILNVGDDIAGLKACFHRRRIRIDASHVNATWITGLSGIFAKLGVARRNVRKTGGWKSFVMLARRLFKEVSDDRRRDGVKQLTTGIITQ